MAAQNGGDQPRPRAGHDPRGRQKHTDEIGFAEGDPRGLRPADGRIRDRRRPPGRRAADRAGRRARGGDRPQPV